MNLSGARQLVQEVKVPVTGISALVTGIPLARQLDWPASFGAQCIFHDVYRGKLLISLEILSGVCQRIRFFMARSDARAGHWSARGGADGQSTTWGRVHRVDQRISQGWQHHAARGGQAAAFSRGHRPPHSVRRSAVLAASRPASAGSGSTPRLLAGFGGLAGGRSGIGRRYGPDDLGGIGWPGFARSGRFGRGAGASP